MKTEQEILDTVQNLKSYQRKYLEVANTVKWLYHNTSNSMSRIARNRGISPTKVNQIIDNKYPKWLKKIHNSL